MTTLNPQPMPEEYERKSWFKRLTEGLIGSEEPEDEELEASVQNARKTAQPLRLQTARSGRVAVRLNAQVFEDAKLAADGLKSGEHQIVNLERATPQMGERIIDFLNGVCYALDGTVERVGDKVYMFVPANVAVEVDSGATAVSSSLRRPNFGEARE
jgi:cell division inhibitor SepF